MTPESRRGAPRFPFCSVLFLGMLAVATSVPTAAAEEAPARLANTLRWSTASEVDNYGFDVYRGNAKEGPFTRLTQTPILGAGTSDVPQKYSYEDLTIEEGKDYWYYVESISMSGTREMFTPVVLVKAKFRQPKAGPAFKILVEEDGVYRLGFEELVAAGWSGGPIPLATLGLACEGKPVPIHLEAGADGLFGPGDRLEFIGHHPRGASSYFDPDLEANVYQLRADVDAPARLRPVAPPPGGAVAGGALLAPQHLERDDLQLRFSRLRGEAPETWYWARATSADPSPLSIGLDLAGHDPASSLPVRLKVALRGWSWQRADQRQSPDHAVEVAWNGTVLGTVEWTGQEEAFLEVAAVPRQALEKDAHRLSFRILPRSRKDGSAIVDVVVLNWVELSFPRRAELAAGQQLRLEPAAPGEATTVAFRSPAPVILYGEAGSRAEARADANTGTYLVAAPTEAGFYAVAGEVRRQVLEVRLDRPSDLLATGQQADYLMISHASLKDAVEPLARFHRQRGLAVSLIDVEDVYDEFSHGLPRAEAIRAFIAHAYQQWAKPAPRFVLLVGDASWDSRATEEGALRTYVDWAYGPRDGTKLRHNQSTAYGDARRNRNLVPTGSFPTSQGHAASDNYFVAMEGFDRFPELAIGRFPVVEPEEVSAIVDKSIRYMAEPELGPWRSRMLWITNEEAELQAQGDGLASQWAAHGYASSRLYPQANGEANSSHQATLRRAFDDGYALVHFHGHGGRYIWRTAAPDYQKNADLFTLEDLDRLAANRRLPVVLSMTCYSAPFDHPTADSIGEKFLRVAGKGAVAVLAASWRNSPDTAFSKALVEEILAAPTVGEGVMRAKGRAATLPMIEQYNLLGDPALTLARPRPEIALTALEAEARKVAGSLGGSPFAGRAEVAWLGETGDVLAAKEVEIAAGGFTAALTEEEVARVAFRGGARAVSAYAVSADGRREALGALDLRPPAESSSSEGLPFSASAVESPGNSKK